MPAFPEYHRILDWYADHLAAQGGDVLIVGAEPVLTPEVGRRAKTLPLARLEGNPRVRILLDVKLQGIRRDRIWCAARRGGSGSRHPARFWCPTASGPRRVPTPRRVWAYIWSARPPAPRRPCAALAAATSLVSRLLPRLR
jgi:hypothetical protein